MLWISEYLNYTDSVSWFGSGNWNMICFIISIFIKSKDSL